MGLSFGHLLIVLVIALIFFGPSRLPSLGKSLGQAIRGFKEGLNDLDDTKKIPDSDERKS
jgi:sec-independent protein translocase protein TatA